MGNASALLEDQLHGFGVLAGTCASALACEPDERVVGAVRQVAAVLGDARFDSVEPDACLTQRFYDRFFVSASPFYVPLHESCVVGARMQDGRMQYASLNGAAADQVLGCYRAVKFDFRGMEGFELSMKVLRPDSMAAELAFMASLANAAAQSGGAGLGHHPARLLDQFVREHPARWFEKAAGCLSATEDDFYARVCSLAAEGVSALLDD